MKKTFLISLLALCTLSLNAQTVKENMTDEEYSERLLWLKGCFEKLSRPEPHNETYTLSSGKTIELKAQSDYKRSAFVSADQLLQDLREWRQSPYTWQLRHRKNNQAIMDGRDLSSWEVNGFDEISQAYFKDCQSTYHIAAHGLLSQDGVVGDGIMIDAYGSPTPLSQVGTIGVPDPRTLSVSVWDKSLLKNVEKALRESDLGLNPVVMLWMK